MTHATLRLAALAIAAAAVPLAATVQAVRGQLVPAERPAIEARLIGQCGGRIMAAAEESAFPATGCDWIRANPEESSL
jgi:hypothetical protein